MAVADREAAAGAAIAAVSEVASAAEVAVAVSAGALAAEAAASRKVLTGEVPSFPVKLEKILNN